MSGTRFLASGRRRVSIGTTMPAAFAQDATNPATVDEVDAFTLASGRIPTADYDLGPQASDEIDDKPLDAVGNAKGIGNKNFGGGLSAYRFFNGSGIADGTDDGVYALLNTAAAAGTLIYVAERLTSKLSTDAYATGDEITVVECLVDVPSAPANSTTEYIKNRFELKPQRWSRGTLAAGTASGVPLIATALPSAAGDYDVLTLTGGRFTGTTGVTVGGTPAVDFTVLSDSTLVLVMPVGTAGSAPIVATNAAGASASKAYTRAD